MIKHSALNYTRFVICTALLSTTDIALAQPTTLATKIPITLELPIAPVGKTNSIQRDIDTLNRLILSSEIQKAKTVYLSIGSAEEKQAKPIVSSSPLIMVGLTPFATQQMLQNSTLNEALSSAIKKAQEHGVMLYFYPIGKPSFEHTRDLITLCSHDNAVFAPVISDPYWIIKSLKPMIPNINHIQIAATQFPSISHLKSTEYSDFMQILPFIRFIDEKSNYYNFRPKDTKINVYYYDQQEGQRELIEMSNGSQKMQKELERMLHEIDTLEKTNMQNKHVAPVEKHHSV